MFAEAHRQAPRILVLDDIPEIRDQADLWQQAGFELRWAADRASGVRQADTLADVLICQYDSTCEQDRDLVDRIRHSEALSQIPLLVILRHQAAQIPQSLVDDPLQDFVHPPFATSEPLLRCQKLLALKHSTELLTVREQEHSAQLLLSENRFRLMVESVEDYAMFMVDLHGGITSWNRGAERLTGYTEAEALGQHFSMLYPREDLNPEHALYELSMARKNGRHEEEGLRVRKDGSRYYAQIQVWPMEDKSGDIIGFVKITRDITARRQAEHALKESEAKFRTITDAMPQMVWSTLPDGNHDYFNEQWYRYTGVKEGETDGAQWNGVLHPDDQARALQVWQRSLKTGETYEIQYRLRHFSGEYRWTLGRALPVRDEAGKIVRWMGTLTDIHEQKQAEEALKDAARRKDEFLAMLAHELRNPLAPVRNSTFLLRRLVANDTSDSNETDTDNARGNSNSDANDKAPALNALSVIERQVRHMTCLIDDLLDVARISRGKIEIRREDVDLIEVVRHTIEDFETDYQAKGVHLQLDITCWTLWLQGDRTRVAQALGNLLHNALKFTEPGGGVTVRVAREESPGAGVAVIQVTDSGVGIDAEITANLFNPFIQANQGLARSKGGLGLGLALVKGFIELHGGRVEAHSDGAGKGSVFTLRLPLMVRKAKVVAEDEMTRPPQPLRVLLIDDNLDMLQTLSALLAMEGHQVTTAEDGESGLDAIRSARPDLVLCDIGLPGALDGYGVARAVRGDERLVGIHLVALSGYGQERDRQLAKDAGFDNHLLKPLNFAELAGVISAACEYRRALRPSN